MTSRAPRPRTRTRPAPGLIATRILGILAAGTGCLLTVLNVYPPLQAAHTFFAITSTFISFGVGAWLMALICWISLRRSWRWLTAAIVGLALHLVWLVPYLPHQSPFKVPYATVMAANLNVGAADLHDLMAATTKYSPDVVVLVEATQSNQAGLARAGWFRDYPYSVGTWGDPDGADFWTVSLLILSKHPVTIVARSASASAQCVVRVDLPLGPIFVGGAHPANPLMGAAIWTQDASNLSRLLRPHVNDRLVAIGDFNAVNEHLTYRWLASLGLHDAAREAGIGWAPTFPANWGIPPLIAIDHALLSPSVTAVHFDTFKLRNSDHRGIVVSIA